MERPVKVATLTFHVAHNYGAMLQAYALEKAINRLGYDCCVLDYRFPYIDRWNGIRTRKDLCKLHGYALGTMKYVSRCAKGYYKKANAREARKKFNSFMHNEMKLSRKIYETADSLSEGQDYDVIVLGSDQIWNPDLTGGVAKEFYGCFFDTKSTKVISYAASSGTDILDRRVETEIPEFLSRLDAIGVREEGLTDYIKTKHNLHAQTVIDPVFLLSKQEWNCLANKSRVRKKEPYLLIYAFQTSDYVYRIAKRIAEQRGLKLISICYEKKDDLSGVTQLTDCGPLDFVSYIKNADYICTTSFHGMAFSIIFEKNFYCVGHPLYAQRNKDLLNSLGLEARMLFEGQQADVFTDIDYGQPRIKLASKIDNSVQFLKKTIHSAIEGES